MTLLVHLTAAKNIRAVRRTGIRAAGHGQGGGAGVYCLPVLPSYQITYQWVRELRRGGQAPSSPCTSASRTTSRCGWGTTTPPRSNSAVPGRRLGGRAGGRSRVRTVRPPADPGQGDPPRPAGQPGDGMALHAERPWHASMRLPVCNPPGQYGAAKIRKVFGQRDRLSLPTPGLSELIDNVPP